MSGDGRTTVPRQLRVFLCHASEDKPVVRDIYQKLVHANIEPWLDEQNLLPGEQWELVIPDIIRRCDIVLLCLSRTFLNKEGYGQSELRTILEAAKVKPMNAIYLIPFLLDDCEVPSYIRGIHYASRQIPGDFEKLLVSCEKRRSWLNDVHGMKIEPLHTQAAAPAPASLGASRDLPDPGERGGAAGALPATTPSGQHVTVEHFQGRASARPITVFLSYVHEDEALMHRLEVHLSSLKREGLISTWCDRYIQSGSRWAGVIDERLNQASLILLLVSADFLASDYCYQVEVKRAMQRHQAGEAIVIPIVMRPVDWKRTPFAQIQALPGKAKAITDWDNQDAAFVNVVAGIRKVVEQLAFSPLQAPSVAQATGVPQAPLVSAGQPGVAQTPEPARPVDRRRTARFGAPFPEAWNVVRRHNPFFTGRDQVLHTVFEGFGARNEGGMIPPYALTALGGMGKTQTAAEYAYRFREHYRAVLWVRAETQENLLADFQAIARLLDCPREDLHTREGLVQTMRAWFLSQTRWLLILDNADDLTLADRFLPRAARGHILVTTRAGAAAGQAQTLQLEPLGLDDGALCILRRAGLLAWNGQLADAPEASVEAAHRLTRLMDGLPLALEQAGAYINDTACGVRRYLNLYQQYRAEIQAIHHGQVPDYPEAVASAWRISRQAVEQSSPAAAELLRLCAYLAPEAIPDELLTAGAAALGPVLGPVVANPVALDQALGLLRKFSLLQREVDRQTELTRLSMHRIIQEILVDEMDETAQQLWAQRAVCAVAQALPLLPWPVLQAHAQNCLQLVERWQLRFPEADVLRRRVEQAVTEASQQEHACDES